MDRLEAIKKRHQPKCYYQGENFEITIQPDPDVTWLISKVAEQDREIAEWKQEHDMVHRQQLETVKLCDRETIRVEKAEARVKELDKILADWKAERGEFIGVLEDVMGEVASRLCGYGCKGCERAQKKVDKARAILAEVKEQG